jgi:hypothetical protein
MPKHSFAGENNPAFKWTLEELQQEALKYKTRGEFKKYSKAYTVARNRNIMDQICSHMPIEARNFGTNNPSFKWTDEAIFTEALKYKTRTDFAKNNLGAYKAAKRRKILDRVCFHMPKRIVISGENHHSFKWTLEKLQTEALKYKTRSEFENYNYNAYTVALNRKILDQICSHML